eukprot:5009537-Amphidinium_carterae.1
MHAKETQARVAKWKATLTVAKACAVVKNAPLRPLVALAGPDGVVRHDLDGMDQVLTRYWQELANAAHTGVSAEGIVLDAAHHALPCAAQPFAV